VATVVNPAARTNTASVRHSDQFDPDTTNNTSSATTTPQQADLVVTKTIDTPRPNVGQVVFYTVTVQNNGPAHATCVAITDLVPAGLTLLQATPSQGAYNAATGLWTVGTLDNGGVATLTLRASVDSTAAQTNTARVSAADQFDPNTRNNTASVIARPQRADL